MSFERTGILLSPKAVLHKPSEQGFIPMSETPLDFDIETPFAVVYDGAKDRFLYRKGGDRVIYPASTTKLLTILASLKVLNPGEIVHPGDELSLLDEDSSVAGVDEGHALTVEMLVEAMLLPSGNDAAYVLAAAAGECISEGLVSGADAVPCRTKSSS
jgi:D-alanyl-D-alanine carboxypeptidase (penicillin-binding protein 5/6)